MFKKSFVVHLRSNKMSKAIEEFFGVNLTIVDFLITIDGIVLPLQWSDNLNTANWHEKRAQLYS